MRAGAHRRLRAYDVLGVIIDLPDKLGIDTGLVYGGKLTCLEFNEEGFTNASGAASGRRRARPRCAEASLPFIGVRLPIMVICSVAT